MYSLFLFLIRATSLLKYYTTLDYTIFIMILRMMIMNCFCGMVDWRKAFSLTSNRNLCQRSSSSRISDLPQAEFEPTQNPSSGFDEWSYVVAVTTTTRRHITVAPQRRMTDLISCYWSNNNLWFHVSTLRSFKTSISRLWREKSSYKAF